MPEVTLDTKALESWLPHRGLNLFVDEVWSNAERTVSRSRTRIPAGDARGREKLLRRDETGRACWSEPMLSELMALTGVCLVHEALTPKNQVSVFSMISKISFGYLPGLGEEVIGNANIIRKRGDFTQFGTRCEAGGKLVLEAEVMSGAAVLADIAKSESRSFSKGTPGDPVDAKLFAWKPAHLRFVDRLVSADKAAGKVVCSYTYPVDHPFVAGHFPGAPLMMGVTQWAAAADAAWVAKKLFGHAGPVAAQCRILRESGAEVLDVRDLVVGERNGVPFIEHTKRLAFRDVVRPADGLLIEATVAPYTAQPTTG
jgi:3-hydroxymyristoyl/3-hydroxydecanoyl-(acyl carrier protein) dehydratase